MITALWLLAIVGANLSIGHFGPEVSIINSCLLIGLGLTTRDHLHNKWDGKHLKLRMGLLIATGGLLSWLTQPAAGKIALASIIAFAISEVVDAVVYHKTRSINKSNAVSAFIDSVLFPTIAFGGFPVLIILGQWVAKVGGGAVWAFILRKKTWLPVLVAVGLASSADATITSGFVFANEDGQYATVEVFHPGQVEVFAFADQYFYGAEVAYGEAAVYYNSGGFAPTVQVEFGDAQFFGIKEVLLAGVRWNGLELLARTDEQVQLTYVWFKRLGSLQFNGYIDLWGWDQWQAIAQPQVWYWLNDWVALGGEFFVSVSNSEVDVTPALGVRISRDW